MVTDAAPRVAGDRGTILVVEDDPSVARLECRHLELAGYTTALAETPEEALAHLREGGDIDLIVLDYRLPGGADGLEFHARLRAAGFDTPVILVAASGSEEVIVRALRAGVRDFVARTAQYLDYLPEAVGRVLRQVRTERRLVESEARLATVIASATDAMLVAGPDHRITLFNAAAEEMFRCPVGEAIGRPLADFLPPDVVAAADRRAAGPSTTPLPGPLRRASYGRRASGDRFPIEASVSRAEVGRRTFYTAVVRDVTERERSAAKIREQAALLDQANDAILVRDVGGRITFWNRGAERLYGWTAAEAVGGVIGGTLDPVSFLELDDAHRALGRTGEWAGELRHIRKDLEEVAVASRWSRLRGPEGRPRGTLVIDSDVTERKRLEAQYLHAQKLEGVGTLAGGVAHDFNNLLTVVVGAGEVLLNRPELDEDSRELVAAILRAGERGAALVRQLLAYGRKQVVEPRVLDLNRVVRETERMLRRLIGSDVEVVTTLAPDLGRVKADPGQLEQVVVNLAVNARDAMADGGTLTIETRNADLAARVAGSAAGVAPGRYVVLSVADTGHGIDEATRARLFEPFFTTKEVGKGTGLGLAAVHGIVQQAGGHVEVESEIGRGTTFRVYLPRVTGVPALESGVTAYPVPRGTETILLAEDEPDVRALAAAALQANGYTVLEAAGGDEGLRIAERYADPIHLLVTDVVMPRVGGRKLAERLSETRPGVRVLFLSGYSGDVAPNVYHRQPGAAFLQKPFTPAVLVRKVREVLDTPADPPGG